MNSNKGFTLVELAVSLTIIALLIGGVLKGKEMIQNARIVATIDQAKAYEVAMQTFMDTYQEIPGDMPDASTRIKGIDASKGYDGGNGDGILGDAGWISAGCPVQSGFVKGTGWNETFQFWGQLYYAKLINGISGPQEANLDNAGPARTHPRSRAGGVFIAGNAQAAYSDLPGWPLMAANPPRVRGVALMVVRRYDVEPSDTENEQPMTASDVAQIDRRLDDGQPMTGRVVYYGSYGAADSCVYNNQYTDDTRKMDCGVVFLPR
jgi:prepilin-type N-terminal cleavage/methylation domain-containing protein